jgi:hypothetical protein
MYNNLVLVICTAYVYDCQFLQVAIKLIMPIEKSGEARAESSKPSTVTSGSKKFWYTCAKSMCQPVTVLVGII